MKKETDSKGTLVYNNEFRWAYVWKLVIFLLYCSCLYIVSLIIPMSLLHIVGFEDAFQLSIGDLRMMTLLVVFICVIVCIKYFKRFRTGKYSITENNLIIHEEYFSDTIDLTIPISQITDVQYTSNFLEWNNIPKRGIKLVIMPYRFLEITVEGQKYQLYTYAHAEELYNELCKHILK